ncbi:hypothetical protein [Spirosoma spitsbergense]|uniref:hypothetical protein n=1 Tax=Spirosoma spitsbergense TaxID=431554 RepID=UPI000363FB46|nr:hypothetical protein [Spirosoma spitsbergense]
MKTNRVLPILVPAKTAVLLVFLPPDPPQRAALRTLINSLPGFPDESLRIIQLDEAIYPEVIRSFTVTHLPALVLVRQGVELWRYEGMPNDTVLTAVSKQLQAIH